MSFKLDFSKFDLFKAEEKVMAAAKVYGRSAGQKMEEDAKNKAPWTDRTGNSRQTISHDVIESGNKLGIYLIGNTPHFPYLELAHEKKWAILWPTITRWQKEILEGWQKAMFK